jgi:hypothetical protein
MSNVKYIEQNTMGTSTVRSSTRVGYRLVQGVSLTPEQTTPSRVVSSDIADKVKRLSSRCKYLTTSNPKTLKSVGYGWVTAILHLAPARYSGHRVCERYAHCHEGCLFHQGRGKMTNVVNARVRKTQALFADRQGTLMAIASDIVQLKNAAECLNLQFCVRLNGLSDLRWEESDFALTSFKGNPTLMQLFPDVVFYDYTKIPYGHRPAWTSVDNYHITFSFDGSEQDIPNALDVLDHGHNVNVVYNQNGYDALKPRIDAHSLHKFGAPMYDNEAHDLRFADVSPIVLISREKGYSKIAI